MATNTTIPKKADWLNPPKPEEHPLLCDIETQMSGAQIRDATAICGRKYELETLWPHEESWADGYVNGVNFYQTGRNRKLPYIAASLRAIDGVPVSELFKLPSDTPEEMRQEYLKNPTLLEAWRRDAIYQRLAGERPLFPPEVLAELWLFYQELEQRRRGVLEGIGPLSTRAGDGGSSLTSLLEKVS